MSKQLILLLLTAILLLSASVGCKPDTKPPTDQTTLPLTTSTSNTQNVTATTSNTQSTGQVQVVALPGQVSNTNNPLQISGIPEQATGESSAAIVSATPETTTTVIIPNANTSSGNSNVVSSTKYHEVVAGDNLYAIASLYSTTVDVLVELNGITDPTSIQIGQRIFLRTTAQSSSSP